MKRYLYHLTCTIALSFQIFTTAAHAGTFWDGIRQNWFGTRYFQIVEEQAYRLRSRGSRLGKKIPELRGKAKSKAQARFDDLKAKFSRLDETYKDLDPDIQEIIGGRRQGIQRRIDSARILRELQEGRQVFSLAK